MVILNHMQGFKNFLLRGNVIDLAVGIIMGTAFTAVVTALVQSPNFDSFLVFGQIKIGVFLTAVVNFLLIAAAVYFAVVLPVEKLNARVSKKKAEDKEDTELSLLKEIRDSLATKK